MAARKNSIKLTDDWRTRIQTSMLVNRLNKIANGEADCTPNQMRALEIALRKTLPDLSAITLSGDPDKPIKLEFGWAQSSG